MLLSDKRLKLTPKQKEAMEVLHLEDTDSLLSYYPFRYEILETKPFSEWKIKDKVTVEGQIITPVKSWHFGRNKTGSKFEIMVEDEVLLVTLFNRPWADKQIKMDSIITINGVYEGKNKLTAISYFAHALKDIPTVTPVYALKGDIKQKTIRNSIEKVLKGSKGEIITSIPYSLLHDYQLLDKEDALNKIHFPESKKDIVQAYRTLKYEEFLRFFATVQLLRNENSDVIKKEGKTIDEDKVEQVMDNMPFVPTIDQEKVIHEIIADMKSTKVMYRLIQGDVGCGKTFVAAMSAYACFLSGKQTAVLAPTEILAKQHVSSMAFLKQYGLRIEVLYSAESTKEKKEILDKLKHHEIDILIGTHSLLEKNVVFDDLGLVIVDEQQRFGVEQRKALKEKGESVDFLLMSATPIPRTLASTLYGDMDISTIETLPAGRKEVITKLIEENSFRSVLKEIEELLKEGHQIYVICASIQESDSLPIKNVEDVGEALKILFDGRYEVGVLHGRLDSESKQNVMQQFYDNQIQVLVSTTVVEVGMNVVNATGMIIYDAERFGLSQLHQLRGRIQRGSNQGHCYLLTSSKDEKALERLNVLVKTNNGFDISYEDLRLRGPGDILGTRQSGVPDFVLGNPITDTKIVETARKDALKIVENQDLEENKYLIEDIVKRNKKQISYMD